MALVTLARFRDPLDAELARARLEGAGIDAVILDQHLTGINWFYSLALGGVRVQVEASDLDAARRALREDHSADLADIPESRLPGDGDDGCPRCGSTRIRARVQRPAAALALATGLPLAPWRRLWTCEACGHHWEWEHEEAERPETVEAERQVQERHSYLSMRAVLAIAAAIAVLYYIHWRMHAS